MEIFGIAIAIFAGLLTYLTWRNGRWMKQAYEATIAIPERIELGQKETREELVEQG